MFRRFVRLLQNTLLTFRIVSGLLLCSFLAFLVAAACHPLNYRAATPQEAECCTAHELKNVIPDHLTAFDDAALPTNPQLIVAVFVVFFVLSIVHAVDRNRPPAITRRKKYLRWVWAKKLPFSSKGDFLPYFFATRAA